MNNTNSNTETVATIPKSIINIHEEFFVYLSKCTTIC